MHAPEIESRLRMVLESTPPQVVCAYLYGSVARGEARRSSDVDAAVLFDPRPASRLDAGPLDLEADLERAVGRPVHLLVLNGAPADLVHRVLRDGRIVLDRERATRIRFEVAKRNEYFDLEPIRHLYRRTGIASMTDAELIAKKLAFVDTCCHELRTLAQVGQLRTDVRERRFVEHTLQVAIQAALDVASHIVSDERLGEPATNRDLFSLLEAAGWIETELARALERMAGFRNVLVHGYTDVDLGIVEDVVREHLTDLDRFVEVIRRRLV